nr:hypothetical transcript [Hymenolepis microstoma]
MNPQVSNMLLLIQQRDNQSPTPSQLPPTTPPAPSPMTPQLSQTPQEYQQFLTDFSAHIAFFLTSNPNPTHPQYSPPPSPPPPTTTLPP